MGGVRAPTAATACVARLEHPKLERTRGNLGSRTPSSSSYHHHLCPSLIQHKVASPRHLQTGALHPHLARSSSSGACGSMDPAVLIFLLYVMIAHELVCGWMQYRRQSMKPRKRAAGPLLRSSARVCQAAWRANSQSVKTDRGGRDMRKFGRIVRKA